MTASLADRTPRPSSLADVLDLILDKGLVIDLYVRVAVVGIELLTIDARIVIASVDTYLCFAEAVNRLDLQPKDQVTGVPGLFHEMTEGVASHKTKGAISGAPALAGRTARSGSGGARPAAPRARRRGRRHGRRPRRRPASP